MQRVHDNGHVYEGTYEGFYCPRCADFKTPTELGPGNTCPIHEIVLEVVTEENWFFRLSSFEGELLRLYEDNPDLVAPDFRRNEALSFIRGGLQDVSLSRAEAELGRAAAVGSRAGHLRLVRRAPQLLHGALFAREGEDLTERFWPATCTSWQGHPQVPFGLLAGAAARRRASSCRSTSTSTASC